MSLMTLAELVVQETKDAIYEHALSIAESLGLPVTSWQPGDPTRSLYHVVSEILATLEETAVVFIKSGFLSLVAAAANEDEAMYPWLVITAKEYFNVDAIEATFATTEVELTNSSGALYVIDAGDLTFKNTSTDKTYHNTSGGTLSPGGTLTVDVEADEAGSDSNASAGEIDDLVTTLLGVTCTNDTAAVASDAEAPNALVDRCREKLGSLSPNGPRDAYSYVAKTPDLTGISTVTRVRVFGDGTTGEVTVYLASASGGVSGSDVTAVEEALATYATPLCVTLTVASASEVTVAVTYQLWIYRGVNKTEDEVEEAVQDALEDLFAARPIGGDIIPPALTGKLYKSLIESAIRSVFPGYAFRVSVSAPSGDTSLTNSQVATLGAVTPTITFIDDP